MAFAHRIAASSVVLGFCLLACAEESSTYPSRTVASGDAGDGASSEDDAAIRGDGSIDEADAATDPGVDAGLDADAVMDAATLGDAAVPLHCTKVAHLGDSLTAYTVDALETAYESAGIDVRIDAYGGRAINQYCCGDTKTGKQAALDVVASGFEGCWVVAMGTNDTANCAADSSLSRAKTIDTMMKAIDPGAKATVMWVNTFTTKTDGYWANANMETWNEELAKAKARWPNMRIYDWASVAKTGTAPFSDGIHHTAKGYDVRNRAIVEAVKAL